MLRLLIALRYLISRKRFGAVNVISAISVAAVAVAAAAMVIVLSVFNGFEQLAQSKLSAVAPDYLFVPEKGKHIARVDSLLAVVAAVNGVEAVAPQIAEKAYARSPRAQMAVTMRGLTPVGLVRSGLKRATIDGQCSFPADTSAIVSVGVAMSLGVRPADGLDRLTLYEPRRIGPVNPANPMAAFNTAELHIEGVYQVEQDEYDRDGIIIPYALAAQLLAYRDMASSIAVYAAPSHSLASSLQQIASASGLKLQDRWQQHEHTFRMIAIEKWISFLMLGFILVIASANIISTLSMLVIDKEANMAILRAMGATSGFIRGIFTSQGWLIVLLGGAAGALLGVLLVLGQMHFGWVKLGASNPELMSIENYPVVLQPLDVLVTFAAIAAVALILTPVVALVVKRR